MGGTFPSRTCAVEGAEGLGFLNARQLVNPAKTSSSSPRRWRRGRVVGTGRSNKNDPNDAMSVAVTALRTRDLRPVQPIGNSDVLRLWAKWDSDRHVALVGVRVLR